MDTSKRLLLGKYWIIEKKVYLNRGGKEIGEILKNDTKRIYYSYRDKRHFYRKCAGFGLQKAIIPKLYRWGVLIIVLHYHGVKGRRVYISHIGDWIHSNIEEDYVKDREEECVIETYGPQKFLPKSEMKEIIEKV